MGLVAEFEITCEGLPLVEVARAVPEATLHLEFHPSEDRYTAFVAAVDGPTEPVEAAFESTDFVDEYTRVRRSDGIPRYRIEPAVGMDERLGDHVDDVAAELGITASSLSERLRRAQTHLVESTVAAPDPSGR